VPAVIHADDRGAVRAVTIDRPERRNAVDHATLEALAEALAACGTEVRVLVLTGAGGHFCAGADLSGVGRRRPRPGTPSPGPGPATICARA
jgi:enoyl-CoA hydratase/carnithine racemase